MASDVKFHDLVYPGGLIGYNDPGRYDKFACPFGKISFFGAFVLPVAQIHLLDSKEGRDHDIGIVEITEQAQMLVGEQIVSADNIGDRRNMNSFKALICSSVTFPPICFLIVALKFSSSFFASSCSWLDRAFSILILLYYILQEFYNQGILKSFPNREKSLLVHTIII
jgi:hypothetical protein